MVNLDPSGRQSRTISIAAATHSKIQLATAMLGELLPIVEMFAMVWLLVITYTWRDFP